ncbi:uncharacterized protein LOC111884109 [Lactuca sativa]|uniref:uncharacterized protein LOC111884109 n=1 Tax=Lactuca sativa TaxID=4236 RepID=UPI0022AFC611|nr:uncharacterized protein LOC111884109 [Lactuca sativa]
MLTHPIVWPVNNYLYIYTWKVIHVNQAFYSICLSSSTFPLYMGYAVIVVDGYINSYIFRNNNRSNNTFHRIYIFTSVSPQTHVHIHHPMEKIRHKMVAVNGINMHVAELGTGPTILFIHGFPELWYTWRHQILYLASHGYHAVALDLRGYGDTTGAPTSDPTKFTTLHVVGDLVALINTVAAPGEDKVFVVGHDWGAIIAWALCLYRPDKVKALVNMSVAFQPRDPNTKPVEAYREIYGNDYYVVRFQETGEIEGEFAVYGTERVLNAFFNYRKPAPLFLPKGNGLGISPDDPIIVPSWMTKEDLEYYTGKFEKTGFTGGLNYYRALDLNWELTGPWTEAKVSVPVKFIVGDLDLTYNSVGGKDYIESGEFKKDVPLLEDVIILEGVAHFLHEEKPEEINKHIHQFFEQFSI